MDQINVRKALISGGIGAGMCFINNKRQEPGGKTVGPVNCAIRGAGVSVATDVISGFVGQDPEDNLITTSLIAGGLNAGWGRYQSSSSNLTKDFFMGALANAGAGYVAGALDERGGIVGMIGHGVHVA